MRAKTIFMIALMCLTVDIRAQLLWLHGYENSGTTSALFSIYFPNAMTGYAVGASGTILKKVVSTNTWSRQTSGTPDNLNCVYFIGSDTGYAVGGFIGGIDRSVILKTTDGGVNWLPQNGNVSRVLRAVFFVNTNTGYAAGARGTVLKTVNGGSVWSPQLSGTTNTLNSLHFTDASTGYAVGNGGVIVKTTDGGISWVPQNSGTAQPLNSVNFTTAATGYVAGGNGSLLRTLDGGSTWTPQSSGTTKILNSVNIGRAGIGFAVGDSTAIFENYAPATSSNWFPSRFISYPPPLVMLNSVHFPVGGTGYDGYAAGMNGTIMRAQVFGRVAEMSKEKHWRSGKFGDLDFSLTKRARVSALLFDARGRLTFKLFNGIAEAGEHSVNLPHARNPGPNFLDFRTEEAATAH